MKIFLAKISDFSGLDNDLIKILSDEEIVRFKSIKNEKTKNQFLLGRALLRVNLAKEINIKPNLIKFVRTPNGKLELGDKSLNIHFNISHSQDIVVIAISENNVGIDAEFIKKRDFINVASEYFSDEECLFIKNSNNQPDDFYIFWTLKEALIKCRGDKLINLSKNDKFTINDSVITNKSANKYSFSVFKYDEYIIALASEKSNDFQVYECKGLKSNNKINLNILCCSR